MNPLIIIVPFLVLTLPSREVEPGDTGRLASARGQHVFVLDEGRTEWEGRLLEVTGRSLAIDAESLVRRFPLGEVERVDVQGDKSRDGALRGAVLGALLGLAVARDGGVAARGAFTFGVMGLGIDALVRNKRTVYRSSSSSPTATPARK